MRKPPRGVLLALPFCLAVYIGLGYGYHRSSVACYESRHSIDKEPLVGGGTVGVAVDVTLWPLFQISEAITSPAVSCVPRPLARGKQASSVERPLRLQGDEPLRRIRPASIRDSSPALFYRRRMSISWEEPPASPPAQATLQDQLRERPGMWARVLTSDKVSISRLGGDLHRDGFEIRPDVQPDADGNYSLYAQWNPGERTVTVIRPGSGEPAPGDNLLDDALTHVLTATIAATRRDDGSDLETVLAAARQQIKALFSGSGAPGRYLQGLDTPQT